MAKLENFISSFCICYFVFLFSTKCMNHNICVDLWRSLIVDFSSCYILKNFLLLHKLSEVFFSLLFNFEFTEDVFCWFCRIPYTQIRLATHNERLVHIELLDDAGEVCSQECFKLVSRKAAVALYRCITEMHSFYRCDTVCSNVHSQYSRDFKGTFVSIFNENSDCGKWCYGKLGYLNYFQL